eukprot:7878393-Pyramimonas_sp.AAC.1
MAHLRQLDWCLDVARMPIEERENFQLVRSTFFSGPAKAAAPDLLLLPHLHEQALLDAAAAAGSAHQPGKDNESFDADGFPYSTDEDIVIMVEAANVWGAPLPGGAPLPEFGNDTMDDGEFSPHIEPILSDGEFEAQVKLILCRSREACRRDQDSAAAASSSAPPAASASAPPLSSPACPSSQVAANDNSVDEVIQTMAAVGRGIFYPDD